MSNKIAQFFKMLSLSQLPRASSENELLSSQNSALSSAATEVEAENQNSPIVSSFLHSCTIEIDIILTESVEASFLNPAYSSTNLTLFFLYVLTKKNIPNNHKNVLSIIKNINNN